MSNLVGEAFVRLRADDRLFRAELNQSVNSALAQTKPVQVRGQIALDGLQEADQQIQGLTQSLQGAANISVAGTFDPLLTSVRSSREEADGLVTSLRAAATGPTIIGADAVEGISEATAQTEELAGGITAVSEVSTTASFALGLTEKSARLAAISENQLAAATLREGQAAAQTAVEEQGLIRVRARRATAVGPLKIAGIGLGAGAAIFAVTQAVGALADSLRVTGEEAFTTEGRLRNVGSSLVRGDIVGAFKSIVAEEERLAPGLKEAVEQLKQTKEEASRVSLQDVVDDSRRFRDEISGVKRELVGIGVPLEDATRIAGEYRSELQRAAASARDNAVAVGEIEAAIRSAGSAAAAFGERGTAFGQGVGGVAAEAAAEAASGGTFLGGELEFESDLPPGIRAAILREQGPGGTEDDLIRVLQQAIANREKRLAQLQGLKFDGIEAKNKQARAIIAVRQDINSLDQQRDELLKADEPAAGKGFQLPVRLIEAQAEAEATVAFLQDDLNIANRIVRFLENARDRTRRDTDRFREIVSALRAAKEERRGVFQQLQEGREADSEAARQAVIDSLGLGEQKLQNALLSAELSENETDDKNALRRLVKFYQDAAKRFKSGSEEALRFRALELQTRARLKSLSEQDAGGGAQFDVFAEAVKNFKEFGSNLAGAGGVLSPQDARGQVAGFILAAGQAAEQIVQNAKDRLRKLPDTEIGDKRFLNQLRGSSPAASTATVSGALTPEGVGPTGAPGAVSSPLVAVQKEIEKQQASRDAQQLAATRQIVTEIRQLGLPRRGRGSEDPVQGAALGLAVGIARNDAIHFPGA